MASSSTALHHSAPGVTSSPGSTRTREQPPASLLPIPGCGRGSKSQNPIFSLCTPALTPRGYGKESSLWGKRLKHDEGRSSLQRKFYIAYDLLSGNIKQFKQPTLNHSDSSTLPTTPRLPSPSSPRPASPLLTHSPGSERSLLPCPRASSTRVCTHTHRHIGHGEGPEAGGRGG